MNVLVVEDEVIQAELLRIMLGHAGYDVLLARDEGEAIDLLRAHPVGAILMDRGLQGADGLDLIRRLKQDPATCPIPVLLVTAWPISREKGIEAGAVEVITKPFNMKALLNALRRALDGEAISLERNEKPFGRLFFWPEQAG
ncbi:MAG: response regulator [Bacteroidota bacterium]